MTIPSALSKKTVSQSSLRDNSWSNFCDKLSLRPLSTISCNNCVSELTASQLAFAKAQKTVSRHPVIGGDGWSWCQARFPNPALRAGKFMQTLFTKLFDADSRSAFRIEVCTILKRRTTRSDKAGRSKPFTLCTFAPQSGTTIRKSQKDASGS